MKLNYLSRFLNSFFNCPIVTLTLICLSFVACGGHEEAIPGCFQYKIVLWPDSDESTEALSAALATSDLECEPEGSDAYLCSSFTELEECETALDDLSQHLDSEGLATELVCNCFAQS